jgi:hypothetical protein
MRTALAPVSGSAASPSGSFSCRSACGGASVMGRSSLRSGRRGCSRRRCGRSGLADEAAPERPRHQPMRRMQTSAPAHPALMRLHRLVRDPERVGDLMVVEVGGEQLEHREFPPGYERRVDEAAFPCRKLRLPARTRLLAVRADDQPPSRPARPHREDHNAVIGLQPSSTSERAVKIKRGPTSRASRRRFRTEPLPTREITQLLQVGRELRASAASWLVGRPLRLFAGDWRQSVPACGIGLRAAPF